LAWNSRATPSNPVRAEYIITEKVAGIELSQHWDSLSEDQKYAISNWLNLSADLPEPSLLLMGACITRTTFYLPPWGTCLHICTKIRMECPSKATKFAVGPTNSRLYFDDGRSDVDIDRGPCKYQAHNSLEHPLFSIPGTSASDYAVASAKREMACISKFSGCPSPPAIHYGPRQYQPSAQKNRAIFDDYLKVAPFLLPKDRCLSASVMRHRNLCTGNIFVDPKDSVKIVGLVDWQSVHLGPLFL
jgi:hypothetical protein